MFCWDVRSSGDDLPFFATPRYWFLNHEGHEEHEGEERREIEFFEMNLLCDLDGHGETEWA